MICYKDMTFCPFWTRCVDGATCHRAFTDDVNEAATKWWGDNNYPISFYAEEPSCFEEK